MSDDPIKVAAVVPLRVSEFMRPFLLPDRGIFDAALQLALSEPVIGGPVHYCMPGCYCVEMTYQLKHDRRDECGTRIHKVVEGQWVHDATDRAECAITPVATPLQECYDCGHGFGWDDDDD